MPKEIECPGFHTFYSALIVQRKEKEDIFTSKKKCNNKENIQDDTVHRPVSTRGTPGKFDFLRDDRILNWN